MYRSYGDHIYGNQMAPVQYGDLIKSELVHWLRDCCIRNYTDKQNQNATVNNCIHQYKEDKSLCQYNM